MYSVLGSRHRCRFTIPPLLAVFVTVISSLAIVAATPTSSVSARSVDSTATPARRNADSQRLDVGFSHGCAVTPTGGVVCWGRNQLGQLGNGTTTNSATPVNVNLPIGWHATSVAVSEYHSCATLTDGGVACWGDDSSGDLGNGPGDSSPGPVRVALPSGRTAKAIDSAVFGTCALLDDGSVSCWGWEASGQLGQGTNQVSYPTPVGLPMPNGIGAIAISVKRTHSCAVLSTGEFTCWGTNTYGQFGNGVTSSAITGPSTPSLLPNNERAIDISAGADFTCVLSDLGRVHCMGRNVYTLGDGTTDDRHTPVLAQLPGGERAVELDVGYWTTCARTSSGAVYCWGANYGGQIGDGTTDNRSTPVPVTLPDGLTATGVGLDEASVCALLSDGRISCWGKNTYGELGDGTTTNRSTPSSPRTVSAIDVATAVAAGGNHTCLLNSQGRVWCWGQNDYGQLGDGTMGDGVTVLRRLQYAEPVALPSPGRAKAITAGVNHTCALLVDGRVSCWGQNSSGQLGVGNTTNRSTPSAPISLQGSGRAKAISAGGSHTCALHTDGTIACWGANQYGQLGDGGNGNQSATHDVVGFPVGGVRYVSVEAGLEHTCAMLSNAQMACWGRNQAGQLGVGDYSDRNSPATVSAVIGTRAITIGAGGAHSCALLDAGSVTCWGDNYHGQLGTGTSGNTTNSPAGTLSLPGGHPTQAVDLAVGDFFTCVLLDDGQASCWGYGGNGEIGDGARTNRLSPTTTSAQPYGSNIRSMSAGYTHMCSVLEDGSVSCWGQNWNGQLGTGDRTDLSVPDRGAAPPFPTGLSATAGNTTAVLTWSEPTSPYQPQTWLVEGSTDGNSWWPATVSTVSPSGTTVSALTNGVAYRFRVTSTTPLSVGTTAASAPVTPQGPVTSTDPSPGGGFAPSPSGWPNITPDRIEGDDPALVAAALSRRRFAGGSAPIVHITLGTRAHDAAAAGAAAVAVGGPVLVVTADVVPSATATELARLASKRIVIVGGLDAISDKLVSELAAINGADVIRASGVDRFETATSVSRISHSSGGTVFVVAGGSGIDGLGVTRFGRPVLLTSSNHLPLITAIELYRLAPSRVVIVGGEVSVTDRVRQQIVGVTGLAAENVERWSGPDRFATAAMAAGAERSSMSTAVLIQGHTLSGVAVATLLGDPRTGLFLARPGCVPASTRSALDRWRPTTVITIGPSVDLTRTC